MSKPELIKRSGWTFIAAALAFATILSDSVDVQIPGSWMSALLLAIGLLSLQGSYGESASRLNRNILLLGAIGTILWNMILASLIAMSSSGILHTTPAHGQRFWIVAFGGPAVALLALTLFGLTTWSSQPVSRWNWRAALAGTWYPVVYFFLFAYLISHNGRLPDPYWPLVKFTFVIQFFALLVLGVALVADEPQEPATA
jgi:hypothetical protein